jgi:hypothetical protein
MYLHADVWFQHVYRSSAYHWRPYLQPGNLNPIDLGNMGSLVYRYDKVKICRDRIVCMVCARLFYIG